VRADNVFFGLFIRGAFVEESGRLAVFLAVSAFIRRLESAVPPDVALQRCAARGLVAALSFAALENVWYADGTAAALLRVFTAAPLHAACGARTARAAWIFPHEPLRAAALFFQTVILHGCYNFLVSGSGILPYAAPVLALTAFAAQALALRRAADGDAYSA
ncbi:MAG: PrsW family intramembrane metalloprotease, partial [Spirochaetaceae bacterium]|nr:PrsW family intramembrane metalloprotease [Spirochaetaceae bacterium]